MAKRDKTDRLLGTMKQKKYHIASGLEFPNVSGDHVRSIKRAAPVDDKDLVNKEYVDTNDPVHWHSKLVASDGAPDPAVSVDAAGEVGIGTATPDHKLHVVGTTGSTRFVVEDTSADSTVKMGVKNDTNEWNFEIQSDNSFTLGNGQSGVRPMKITSGDNIIFNDEGRNRSFRIESDIDTDAFFLKGADGFVGLGVANPLDVLHLNGANDSAKIRFSDHGTIKWGGDNTRITSGSNTKMDFYARNGTHTMTLDAGNVGIRKLTPGAPLDVEASQSGGFGSIIYNTHATGGFGLSVRGGNDASNDALRVQAVGGSYLMVVEGGGNTSIGHNAPLAKFDVIGDTRLGDSTTNYMEVSATGDVVFVGTAGLAYGGISAYDAGATITITTAGIANKVQITAFDTDDPNNNTTPAHAQDHITITKAGDYMVNVSISAESAAAGGADEFGFAVYKNNGATLFQNLHVHRKLGGGGGDTGSVSMSGIVTLAVNDTIEVWCWNEDSTDNVVIDDITLSLTQIGG